MNKQPDVTDKTRSALVDSFWRLYGDAAVNQIKIRAITDTAGYNRSTFYQYFDDIYDLLDHAEAVLLEDMTAYYRDVLGVIGGKGEPAGFVEKATAAYEHFGFYLSKLLGPNGDPSFAARYRASIKPLLVEEFGFDVDDPATDIVCEFCLGALVSCVSYWYENGKPIPAERLARLFHLLLTEGAVHSAKP